MNDETQSAPAETKQKYLVHKSNVTDEAGKRFMHGATIELGAKLAKKYNKMGYLRPFINEDEEEEEEVVKPSRRKRIAT